MFFFRNFDLTLALVFIAGIGTLSHNKLKDVDMDAAIAAYGNTAVEQVDNEPQPEQYLASVR
jgi:hypothetical protein